MSIDSCGGGRLTSHEADEEPAARCCDLMNVAVFLDECHLIQLFLTRPRYATLSAVGRAKSKTLAESQSTPCHSIDSHLP